MTKLLDLICIAIVLLLTFWTYTFVHAEEWSDDEVVQAIYEAEGGRKASKPYGIMLHKCNWDNIGYCELACYQTVRKNRKRYAEWGHKSFPDYLSFLQSRYAPTENATNDPLGLNRNWLKNVTSILERKHGK